ncbi:hypothetical protein [Streptomyces sp. NPDC003006]
MTELRSMSAPRPRRLLGAAVALLLMAPIPAAATTQEIPRKTPRAVPALTNWAPA